MKLKPLLGCAVLCGSVLYGENANCDLQDYKPVPGMELKTHEHGVTVTWQGERGEQLRAAFQVRDGAPTVEELAARTAAGKWLELGRNLTPEYQVTTGRRRLSEQQMAPLRRLKIPLTPELISQQQWYAFWDAPLNIPGNPGTSVDLPRRPEEIRREWASFHATSCAVKTDGARIEVTFPGVTLGIFSGELRYTAYRGSNLLRQEVIAATSAPNVAYKYVAGLKGFQIGPNTRIVWRDVARNWQQYQFGGAVNRDPVPLIARNRLGLVETDGAGTLGFLPPPHKFFFAREIETNLGFVYYRKDSEGSFAVGVRQAEHEQPYRPYGVSDTEWNRRADEARHDINNFALYNAPPGTKQHMPVYFYLSAADPDRTQRNILAYTHDDRYKALPGYKVLVSHFHMHFNEQLADAGTVDLQPSWYSVFRGLGINIVILADFHSDSHPNDPGPLRFKEQKIYFEGCGRFSDRDFLLIPGEEPDANLGGHYMFVFPRPLYWSHVRERRQTFAQNDPTYGPVFHSDSAKDELELLRREDGYMWQTHPRTKGSAGYPDAVRNSEHFNSDRFIGGSYQSLPVDQSEKRLCEARCLGLLDDMNNWADAKYMLAEGDTYMKYPDDETYPQLLVNYVKLDRVPAFGESWTPVLKTIRAGDYFVSSGEVLFRSRSVQGSGAKRTYIADVEWTFPLEFAELVWGDGTRTDRKLIPANDLAPFGEKRFEIPFDTTGKKWIRFAVWDSAGNGAFTQPVHLK
ncbi:MAG: hypothetical protein JOZ62_10725 [Acidobacteriaceae bacterium]|nr:hypothetical protein [Acidobacteriaceae bacterium]